MNSPKLLLPIRIPELGPSLGKLVSGTPRPVCWLPLDEIRYRLVTRIMESAGEARRLVANEERAAALASLGRATWQEAWEEAVTSVAELLLDEVSRHLNAEAESVRMSRRRRARLEVGAAERRALAARLSSSGTDLITAMDHLEECRAGALGATALERDEVAAWQDALKLAARRLEASWLALEHAVAVEEVRWRQAADDVASWRRPIWPILLVGVGVMSVALWLGLVFAGYVETPAWLQSIWNSVFGQ